MAKVTYAKLTRIMFIPTIGEVPLTLPPNNKSWKLTMEQVDSGVMLNITQQGKLTQAVVPYGNIDGYVLAAPEVAAVKKSA